MSRKRPISSIVEANLGNQSGNLIINDINDLFSYLKRAKATIDSGSKATSSNDIIATSSTLINNPSTEAASSSSSSKNADSNTDVVGDAGVAATVAAEDGAWTEWIDVSVMDAVDAHNDREAAILMYELLDRRQRSAALSCSSLVMLPSLSSSSISTTTTTTSRLAAFRDSLNRWSSSRKARRPMRAHADLDPTDTDNDDNDDGDDGSSRAMTETEDIDDGTSAVPGFDGEVVPGLARLVMDDTPRMGSTPMGMSSTSISAIPSSTSVSLSGTTESWLSRGDTKSYTNSDNRSNGSQSMSMSMSMSAATAAVRPGAHYHEAKTASYHGGGTLAPAHAHPNYETKCGSAAGGDAHYQYRPFTSSSSSTTWSPSTISTAARAASMPPITKLPTMRSLTMLSTPSRLTTAHQSSPSTSSEVSQESYIEDTEEMKDRSADYKEDIDNSFASYNGINGTKNIPGGSSSKIIGQKGGSGSGGVVRLLLVWPLSEIEQQVHVPYQMRVSSLVSMAARIGRIQDNMHNIRLMAYNEVPLWNDWTLAQHQLSNDDRIVCWHSSSSSSLSSVAPLTSFHSEGYDNRSSSSSNLSHHHINPMVNPSGMNAWRLQGQAAAAIGTHA
jgi:hypothetical protein